jgi:hypothetical protein
MKSSLTSANIWDSFWRTYFIKIVKYSSNNFFLIFDILIFSPFIHAGADPGGVGGATFGATLSPYFEVFFFDSEGCTPPLG